MQVIEPRKVQQKQKRRSKKPILLFVVVLVAAGGGYYYTHENAKNPSVTENKQTIAATTEEPKKGVLKTFTGEEFKNLYNSIAYPNTHEISEKTVITGNPEADAHIRKLALAKGYLPQSAPVTDTFRDAGKGHLLQERATQPWLDMKAAAKAQGINLGLTAGYRSAEDQKAIFLNRLVGVAPAAIASGAYDAQINQVLRSTALPGYSRHHTGYTVDISCENDPYPTFKNSKCFTWLSANNYENAKKHGWIPSYPDGAGQQGPDPESWEYVWVGVDTLTEWTLMTNNLRIW